MLVYEGVKDSWWVLWSATASDLRSGFKDNYRTSRKFDLDVREHNFWHVFNYAKAFSLWVKGNINFK